MTFSNLKISTKLSIGFGLMMLIIGGMGIFAWAVMYKFAMEWESYQAVVAARKDAISLSYKFLNDGTQNFKNFIIRGGDYNERFLLDMENLDTILDVYKKVGELPGEEAEILNNVKKGLNNYRDLMRFVIVDMKKRGSGISEIDKLAWNADKPLIQALGNLVRINDTRVNKTAARIKDLLKYFNYLTLGVILLAVVITGMASYFLSRSITSPLNKSVEVANLVAGGDLTSNIIVRSDDETGQLMQALKRMNENLAHIVGEVRSSTDSMAVATRELVIGNSDLSQRTEEQASSLEETASTMEEFTETVKRNSDYAKQANQLATDASLVAVRGGKVVDETVTTMGSINQSSKKIVDIIGVIDSIAFQTNILALNAAVEAARAGEQGRGFAVVATEVRNLAQRSATAAKEIKSLITDSVEKINNGTKLVDDAGKTMKDIVLSIKKVSDIVSEIATASIDQRTSIEQVNKTVNEMERVTQQNAALVEQAAAAAEALEEQAQHLAGIVRVFKLVPYQKVILEEEPNFAFSSTERLINKPSLALESSEKIMTPLKTE